MARGRPRRAARSRVSTPRARRARASEAPALPAPNTNTRRGGSVRRAIQASSAYVGDDRARDELLDVAPRSAGDRGSHLRARDLGQESGAGARFAEPGAPEDDGRGELRDRLEAEPSRRFAQDVGADDEAEPPVGVRARDGLERPQRAALAAELLFDARDLDPRDPRHGELAHGHAIV